MKIKFIYTIIISLIFTSNLFSIQEINSLDQKKIEKHGTKNFCNANTYQEYPPLIFDNYVHNLTGISALGDYVIIEDGSQWKIDIRDYNEAYSWKSTDPILISLNDSFISSFFYGYKYKMTNLKTNTYIEVKLNLGPILTNPLTLFISSINYYSNQVI